MKTAREALQKKKAALDTARDAGITSSARQAQIFPMLAVATLANMRDGLLADVIKARSRFLNLDAELQKVRDDSSRTQDYMRQKFKDLRDVGLPGIAEVISTFAARLERVIGSERYWKSRALVMSLQRFDPDLVKDSVIRQRYIAEFALMPAAVLQLAADAAKMAGDLPLLWQAYLAAQRFEGKPGWSGIKIDDVTIPAQDEALQLIDECKAMNWAVHSLYATACGNDPMLPADKISAVREFPALQKMKLGKSNSASDNLSLYQIATVLSA